MTLMDPECLRTALRHEGGLSRRLLLAWGTSLAAVPLLGTRARAQGRMTFKDNPFTLGVASGDPDSRSVVLWTRLAPRPLEPGGGLAPEPLEVIWEVATDESMQSVFRSGTTLATPQLGHSVHVELSDLAADRWYWFRFRCGDFESPVGRTRTMPEDSALPDQLRFAVTSCQNYEQGLFTAYDQMARDEVDLVFHLGDYIYEYESGRNGKVRTHQGGEIQTLSDYRIRYAQYRLDPLLHGMHAHCPWLVTWDDHEFDNNWAGDVSEERGVDPQEFLLRKLNAFQAYYEMMPLRAQCRPRGAHMQLYRKTSFGRLAQLMVLDTRQYRTDQPNGDGRRLLNEAALSPNNTLLGSEQRAWLQHSLVGSEATWNVLAQQVMMGMVGFPNNRVPEELSYSMDQWPGYAAERMQLVRFLEERRVPGPVVLTGDIHSNWVNELRVDDLRPDGDVVATEFAVTSLSSGGNGTNVPAGLDKLKALNPCLQYHNHERGYLRCTVPPKQWVSDFVVVDDVLQPGGSCSTRASFAVEAGSPLVHSG